MHSVPWRIAVWRSLMNSFSTQLSSERSPTSGGGRAGGGKVDDHGGELSQADFCTISTDMQLFAIVSAQFLQICCYLRHVLHLARNVAAVSCVVCTWPAACFDSVRSRRGRRHGSGRGREGGREEAQCRIPHAPPPYASLVSRYPLRHLH